MRKEDLTVTKHEPPVLYRYHQFPYVLGMCYRIWNSPAYMNAWGVTNGCYATAVGLVVDDAEPPGPLEARSAWHLKYTPKCVLLRIHDTSLLPGRIGDLPFGVIPFPTSTVEFTVNVSRVDPQWANMQRGLGVNLADSYTIRRTGLQLKVCRNKSGIRLNQKMKFTD